MSNRLRLEFGTIRSMRYNTESAWDPQTNIEMGLKLISRKIKQAGGDVRKALGYYAAGRAGFEKHDAATQEKIMAKCSDKVLKRDPVLHQYLA